ncbi:zinc finger MYM-type protein 1-like [Melanaphis sacchari]|uniref:zinc finger MYM-type protein 1-like n=1 Tax=Melanaphis sacchari TaxID=742174 RepID=UPI000DC140A9|nr:zinc finger MYM-type protein 1-like [Melanaphis sacchari]
MFERKHFNGQIINRPWLIYSEITGKVFCGPCRLFQEINNDLYLASEGYNDWRSASARLKEHENSSCHKTCVVKLMDRGNVTQRIDSKLMEQVNQEKIYWKNVLTRIVAIVKKLASRGLPFRGHDEIIGSVNNGNFLMIVELLSEFDLFLSQHVTRFQNSGSGNTSYLSSTIYEEIIKLISKKVKNAIVAQIKTSKYYSIIVDSTPDISHIDQLSFIVRYVNEKGNAMERFLGFIDNAGHKSEKLTNIVIDTLDCLEINLIDCRGQAYDNANNMSESYKSLQARIRELNPLAFYIPCAAHSLNLVGTHSAETSSQSVKCFCLLQHVYNFFSASTHRWSILTSLLKSNAKMVKSLSFTRWSSRNDACVSLNESWDEIIQVLSIIELDKTEKSETICEASGLRIQLEKLEMAFMAVLWGFLLNRLNAVSKKLQDVNIDVCTVLELYDSLIHLVNSQRDAFDEYEEKALSKDLYPNIEIALRIFVPTPATNCTAERSFSVLKRMKNYLQSTMSLDRLNSLAILTIESDLTSSLEYEDIIDDFSRIKSRKKPM